MSYPKGKPKSEESRVKASASCKLAWTEEKRQQRAIKYTGENNPFHSKRHSQKSLEKMSQSHTGVKLSEEHKAKVSMSLIGNKRALGAKHERSLEFRKKLSESKKGNKSPWWRGGITLEHQRIRSSFEYRQWRTQIFERDNYTCVECGTRNGNGKAIYLQADHIKPFAYYPELRFKLSNGRTLCIDCHRATPTYGFRKQYV